MIVNDTIRPPRTWRIRFPFTVAFIDCITFDEELGRVRFTAVRIGPLFVNRHPCWAFTWLPREERRP